MKYSNIISDFTWSFSRIKQFEMCPYAFLLNYIKHTPKKPQFFSSYGSFVHKLMERYLTGELKKDELASEYLMGFRRRVRGDAPNENIFKTYFMQGFDYLNGISFPYQNIACVEQNTEFLVDGNPFVGIIDCVAIDGDNLILVDHKSRALKERSKRKKPTKTDEELDDYLRQLYLYCIPVADKFHRYPTRLEFNCYRIGKLISEPFCMNKLDESKKWASKKIEEITDNDDWSPKMDFWRCRYLCDFCDECDYYQMCK